MPQLVFRSRALDDLAEIATYIERESGIEAATSFTAKIVGHCEHLASLPGRLGRPRPDLGSGYRSAPFQNRVIVFRYADEDGDRSHFYIITIVHASRDRGAYRLPFEDDSN